MKVRKTDLYEKKHFREIAQELIEEEKKKLRIFFDDQLKVMKRENNNYQNIENNFQYNISRIDSILKKSEEIFQWIQKIEKEWDSYQSISTLRFQKYYADLSTKVYNIKSYGIIFSLVVIIVNFLVNKILWNV